MVSGEANAVRKELDTRALTIFFTSAESKRTHFLMEMLFKIFTIFEEKSLTSSYITLHLFGVGYFLALF